MKKQAFNKLYQNLFYIPKYAKLPDKVFRCRITFSIISVLACAAVMISSAFALFTSEIHNTSVLKSAVWNISVKAAEDKAVYPFYTCEPVTDDKHTFSISGFGGASGYCVIKVESTEDDAKIFYTDKFSSDIQITIQAKVGCQIIFTPHWGDPSDFGIFGTYKNNEMIRHSTTPVEKTEELGEEASDGDEDSTLSDDTPSNGEDSTPSDDSSSSGEDSTPSDDAPSSGEGSTPSDDTSSSGEDSTPSDDAPSSGEDSTPSDDAPSGGEDSTPSSDAPSSGESSTPSDDTSNSGEDSTPSDDTPSSGESSTSSGDASSSGESSTPSSSAPSSGESSTPSSSAPSSGESSSSSSGSSGGGSSSAPSSDGGE